MNEQHTISLLTTLSHLADVLETLDACHTAVGEHRQEMFNPRGQAELTAMLREIAFIANETVAELEAKPSYRPVLRLIKGNQTNQQGGPNSVDALPDGDRIQGTNRFQVLDTPTPLSLMKRAGG